LGHSLTGIIAGIDACLTLIDLAPEEVKKQLNIIGNVARQGMKDVRRSVSALRPDELERLSLEEAIKQILVDTNMVSKAEIIFDNKVNLSNLDEDEKETIYRIIRYLLPKCNLSFQVNVDPNYDVAIQMIIYKKNSSGQFVEIQKIFTTANKGSGISIGAGGIVDSDYYAVGVRSFTLNTVTLSGYLMCDFD
jgi:hypothetical protein